MARSRIADIRTTRAPYGGNARKMTELMRASHTDETKFDAHQNPDGRGIDRRLRM
jgi:hypothetical protein